MNEGWLAGVFTVLGTVIGAALSLASELARRRWTRRDADIERRKVRSETAAREVLEHIDAIEHRLRDCRTSRDVPSQKEMAQLTRPLRDCALLIGDGEVRVRLEAIALVAEQLDSIEAMGEYEPHRIAGEVSATGRNAVAHVLSGEPLTEPSPTGGYVNLVEEHWRWLEEEEAEHRAQQ